MEKIVISGSVKLYLFTTLIITYNFKKVEDNTEQF